MSTREQRARRAAAPAKSRDSFHLLITAAMTCTVFLGFSFTYFGP